MVASPKCGGHLRYVVCQHADTNGSKVLFTNLAEAWANHPSPSLILMNKKVNIKVDKQIERVDSGSSHVPDLHIYSSRTPFGL